jgi:hypothetical protein
MQEQAYYMAVHLALPLLTWEVQVLTQQRELQTLAGNIRTSARTFSTAASYGFVGNGGMSSGSALPTQVVGLYVYKNTAGDTVRLNQPSRSNK